MVCSQVYSQHPSRCLLSVAHQRRSWGPSNADMRLLDVETGEVECMGNTARGGNLRPSKGYASTSSPIISSWVRRLIPTRPEPPQLTKSLHFEREGIDGSYDAVFNLDTRDQAHYENSRRSKQVFSRHEHLSGSNSTGNEHTAVNAPAASRLCTSFEVLHGESQVSPRTLPVVESLLTPGCSKDVADSQVSSETNKLHHLSKCSGFANPIKQAVHISADERSRVYCSSIEGLNSRRAFFTAGDLNATLMGEKCFNTSQPTVEFSFNHSQAAMKSNMDLMYGRRKAETRSYLGTHFTNGPQIEDPILDSHSESRNPVAFTGWPSIERRYGSDESRLLDGHSTPDKARDIESFPECFMQADLSIARADEGLHADQKSMQTMSNRDCWRSQEHQDYGKVAKFDVEVSCGKGGASSEGGCSNSGLRKDGVSDLVSSKFEANVREKASISLAHCVIEQELGSSQDSHKEQDGTSGSFSFQSQNRLPYGSADAKVMIERGHCREKASISLAHCVIEQELGSSQDSHKEQDGTSGSFCFRSQNRLPYGSADAKVMIERGHWPDCETTLYTERSLAKDRVLAEASRQGMPFNNVSATQHEAGAAYTSRSQCSPFFGTDSLADFGRHKRASEGDMLPCKPTFLVSRGEGTGESNTEALCKHGVNQAAGFKQDQAKELNDKVFFPRLHSDSSVNSVEEREHKYSHHSRTISRKNWEGFKPPLRISTLSTGSIQSCLKRPADLGTEDPAINAEARNTTLTMDEGAVVVPAACLGKHLHSLNTGSGLNIVPEGSKPKEHGARSWDGSVLKKNLWLKRWSSRTPREEHSLSRGKGIVHSRRLVENDYSISQGSWESSYSFDLRPTKRACYGQRIDLHSERCKAIPVMGSIAIGRESQQEVGFTSHFLKRFLTPSAAALAIMGMTARRVHASQPQSRGLFGVWPVNSSSNKPITTAQVEASKESLTREKNKKEFLQSSANLFSAQVDA